MISTEGLIHEPSRRTRGRTYHARISLDVLQADPTRTHQLALNNEVLEGRDVTQDVAESVALEVTREFLSAVRINNFEHFNVLLARDVFDFKSVVLGNFSALVVEAAVVISNGHEFFLDVLNLDGNRVAFRVDLTRVLFRNDVNSTLNSSHSQSAAEELLGLRFVH